MPEHIFISYARQHDTPFTTKLYDQLKAEGFSTRLDCDDAETPSQSQRHIEEGIQRCWVVIFVVTKNSISLAYCREACILALNMRKPVLPVILDKVQLLSPLERRHSIDFTGDFTVALAKLRLHLMWLRSARGELQTFRDRLADLERELAVETCVHPNVIQAEIQEIHELISQKEHMVARVDADHLTNQSQWPRQEKNALIKSSASAFSQKALLDDNLQPQNFQSKKANNDSLLTSARLKIFVPSQLPDLITPGLSKQELIAALTPVTGKDLALLLSDCSKTAISAVEIGDFKLFTSVGKQIEVNAHGYPEIEATGRYFAGEGYRLQADLETEIPKKKILLEIAVEHYLAALESEINSPRSLRGLARICHLQQDFDNALQLIERAKGIALTQMSIPSSSDRQFGLSHEILRITRHHVDFLIGIQASNPLSIWHREHKKRQLEGYIIESDNFHRERLPLFEGQKRWSQFEWFAGLLFLARAWGNAGNFPQMVQYLLQALWSRRLMLDGSRPLTQIERANLQWWIHTTLGLPQASSIGNFYFCVEQLEQALDSDNTDEILRKIDDLIRPIIPPWNHKFLEIA